MQHSRLHGERIAGDGQEFIETAAGGNAGIMRINLVEVELRCGICVDKRQAACVVVVVSGKDEVSPSQSVCKGGVDSGVEASSAAGIDRVVHHHHHESVACARHHAVEPSQGAHILVQPLHTVGIQHDKAQVGKVDVIGGAEEILRPVERLWEILIPKVGQRAAQPLAVLMVARAVDKRQAVEPRALQFAVELLKIEEVATLYQISQLCVGSKVARLVGYLLVVGTGERIVDIAQEEDLIVRRFRALRIGSGVCKGTESVGDGIACEGRLRRITKPCLPAHGTQRNAPH